MLLAASISVSMPLQVAAKGVQVMYNGQKVETKQEIVLRNGQVWIPIETIAAYVKCDIRYDEEDKMISFGSYGTMVVKADSPEDEGNYPILLNGTIYINPYNIENYLRRTVKWDNKTKTLYIGSKTELYPESPDIPESQFKYDLDNGDFYNGKVKVATIPFDYTDVLCVDKCKTDRMNVIYKVTNIYGEPHINYELFSIYVVGKNTYIAASRCGGWDINVNNAVINGNTVVLLDQDQIEVYDDTTGKLKKVHKINEQPLVMYASSVYEPEDAANYVEQGKKGYLLEAAGEQFALYRHCALGTLTYVNLETDEEVVLYQEVYSPTERAALEADGTRENDGLQFVKVENGMLYLKQSTTGKTYTYKMG